MNDELIGTILAALIGLFATLYTFVSQQRENRRWKQTEFLLRLNQDFFKDTHIRECIDYLERDEEDGIINTLFVKRYAELTEKEKTLMRKFENLFQFFSQIRVLQKNNTLTLEQVNLFGWYLHKIKKNFNIHNYCLKNGFSDVIDLASDLERYTFAVR